MKPCPECGEAMRLAAGQWIHVKPGRCHTVTLRATPEDLQHQTGGTAGRADRSHQTGKDGGWRFSYLTPESLAPPGGD
jgi:hypothetical protein